MGKPVWVRYVLVPGLTDDPANVEGVAKFVAPMKNVEWVEVLPFHQLGAFKWKELGLEYSARRHAAGAARARRPRARAVPRRRLQRAIRRATGTTAWKSIQTLLEQQPLMALFLTIAIGYLVGRDQHQGVFPRRRRGAVRRARDGLVRAEVGAGADGRDARPRALPLRRGRPVRQAVLHRPDQRRGPQGEPDRVDRRAGGRRGEPPVREGDEPRPRVRARAVRRFGDQHADAAGGDRDARQRRSGGGLFGLVSVRRGRADPVPLHRVHDPEAEDRRADVRRPRNARNRDAQSGSLRARRSAK